MKITRQYLRELIKEVINESVNEDVNFRDGKYRFYSKKGIGYLTYDGKVLSSGDYDFEGGNAYWMSHSSWKGDKAFDTGKDVIAYFKKNKIVDESINEDVWTPKQKSAVSKLDSEFDQLLAKRGIEPHSKEASNLWRSSGFQKKFMKIFNKTESVTEGNAFGMAVTKAKEEGKDEFEFNGKTYRVKKSKKESKLGGWGSEIKTERKK